MMLRLTGLLSLSLSLPAAVVFAGEAAMLLYQVSEAGLEDYPGRILVTPTHVRMDEGDASTGYTLFDREQEIIYGISDIDRSILVIDPPPSQPIPERLRLSERVEVDEQAPRIAGRRPRNVTLLVNGAICNELVSVPGLLDDAVEGIREFRRVLGRAQQATLGRIPNELQSDCDLVEFVFAPERMLGFGLPIREQRRGYRRFLVDFAAGTEVPDALFVVPAGYARMAMPSGG